MDSERLTARASSMRCRPGGVRQATKPELCGYSCELSCFAEEPGPGETKLNRASLCDQIIMCCFSVGRTMSSGSLGASLCRTHFGLFVRSTRSSRWKTVSSRPALACQSDVSDPDGHPSCFQSRRNGSQRSTSSAPASKSSSSVGPPVFFLRPSFSLQDWAAHPPHLRSLEV